MTEHGRQAEEGWKKEIGLPLQNSQPTVSKTFFQELDTGVCVHCAAAGSVHCGNTAFFRRKSGQWGGFCGAAQYQQYHGYTGSPVERSMRQPGEKGGGWKLYQLFSDGTGGTAELRLCSDGQRCVEADYCRLSG